MNQIMQSFTVSLTPFWQGLYLIISFCIVAFGQPAWSPALSLVAAVGGYALFWRAMWARETLKERFWFSTCWFTAVQLVQLSWLVTHPYAYIWAVYLFFSFAIGLQFGLVSLLVSPERVIRFPQIVVVAAGWTVMEWLRLFFFSGFTFDVVGLALSAHLYPLQTASIWGIYGMSFYVIFTNLVLLRLWLLHREVPTGKRWHPIACCYALGVIALPYLFGMVVFNIHEREIEKHPETIDVLLVQTGFPAEELLKFKDINSAAKYVLDEWRQILHILAKYRGKHIDLIAMPESLVPYGTYYAMYPHSEVRKAFHDIMGTDSLNHLPGLEEHFAAHVRTERGNILKVNNAYFAQAIANLFRVPVIVGFDDHENIAGENHSYNAAMTFCPGTPVPQRYEKRVLLPLAEYMPFSFCKSLAAKYGVGGSFTCGMESKLIKGAKIPVTASICYEETFGHLMRENRLIGGELLVNITSDVWYPNSKLPQQHFDLARLRTVENGMPLVRACCTGVTGAVDSLGRVVGVLGEGNKDFEWLSDGLLIKVPTYNYSTLYTYVGDDLVIGLCWLVIIAAFGSWNYSRNKEQE